MELQTAFEQLLTLLADISFIPFAVGFVVVVTQLLKNALKLEGTRAALVALLVQVIVWVAYSIAKWRGLDVQFEQWVTAAETIIRTLASVLFPALLSVGGAQYAYNKLTRQQAPGFRDNRPVYKSVSVQPELDGKP